MPMGETIVALATPAVESALGIVRASGPLCEQLLKDCFTQPPKAPRQLTAGWYKSLQGNNLDNCTCIFYAEGASYTGEAMLEFFLHGNPFIARAVLDDLLARGCRAAEPGEFTRTAFLKGQMDIHQAEAVADLINARSHQSLRAAERQLSGELGTRLEGFQAALIELLAKVEAYIDFPEEDLPAEDNALVYQQIDELKQRALKLAATHQQKVFLQGACQLFIIGAPNAGKSSLFNTLLRQDRVLVSPQAGTTRDAIKENLELGPYKIELVDTAGFGVQIEGDESRTDGELLANGGSEAQLEASMAESPQPNKNFEMQGSQSNKNSETLDALSAMRAAKEAKSADVLLFLVDSSKLAQNSELSMSSDFWDLLKRFADAGRLLVAENKVDLPETQPLKLFFKDLHHLRISAKTGAGLDELQAALLEKFEALNSFANEDDLLLCARSAESLRLFAKHLQAAMAEIQKNALECVASELQAALDLLSTLLSKDQDAAVLDALFGKFCIGK